MLTIEEKIRQLEAIAESYDELYADYEEHGLQYTHGARQAKSLIEEKRQEIAWLRELQERREKDKKIGRGNARWLISSDGYYPYCSACMAEPNDGKMTDFCPSCGARMKGKIT